MTGRRVPEWIGRTPDVRIPRAVQERVCSAEGCSKRAATLEDFSPTEIFERDGWKCLLCNKKTNPKAKWPAPDFPTLDHIVPLALGGAHARVNVQCAHLACNIKKCAGPGGQLRLFG